MKPLSKYVTERLNEDIVDIATGSTEKESTQISNKKEKEPEGESGS
ncbi:hypothetical protein [Flavobacterium sp.]|nr:hypothetical protein [Flavobacterium sp.]|tara:strand:+ start:96 stop:233 length:138 start_codon:yes stop_codon:yes gene_type:complete